MPGEPTRKLALSSLCIHGGQRPDPETGAVMPPISLATTYAQASPGRHQGYAYARGQNPTRYALERCIASLEESPLTENDDLTQGGFAFASGLAATAVALDLLEVGDHVLAARQLHPGNAGHGRHVLGIDLTQLLDPGQNLGQLSDQVVQLLIRRLDPGKDCDMRDGGLIQRHSVTVSTGPRRSSSLSGITFGIASL